MKGHVFFILKIIVNYGKDCKIVRNKAVKSMLIRFIKTNRWCIFLYIFIREIRWNERGSSTISTRCFSRLTNSNETRQLEGNGSDDLFSVDSFNTFCKSIEDSEIW